MKQALGLEEASVAFLQNWEPAKRDQRPLTEGGQKFELVSEFEPAGDQPQAIAELIEGIEGGAQDQVLLGVTGSGKTFTMAHVIQKVQRPTIILAPNKILAAQLYGEMKEFFRATQSNISSPTTTTTNQKLTCHGPTLMLKKKRL